MSMPTVALVGRPNVGKSTLFNKIVGKKVSIIEDIPGVTRDRIYQEAIYNKKKFYLVDTGGIDATKMTFNDEIKMQAEIAIKDADIVVFIVDGKEGLTQNDLIVRDILRKSNKEVKKPDAVASGFCYCPLRIFNSNNYRTSSIHSFSTRSIHIAGRIPKKLCEATSLPM
jgi:small GTP-binding protein